MVQLLLSRAFALPTAVLACFLFAIEPGRAADPVEPVPPIIQSGFDAYAKDGAEAAVAAWTKGSYAEDDKATASSAETFKQVERYTGKYKSFELLDTKEIGTNSRFVFCEMDFEGGALFVRFLLYRTDKDWTISGMVYKMSPEEVMPWLNTTAGKLPAAAKSPN